MEFHAEFNSICSPDVGFQWATQLHNTTICSSAEKLQTLSSQAKQAPCESRSLSTLDSDELQLCDEQLTCHLEIQAQLLPMKQITEKNSTSPQSQTTTLSNAVILAPGATCATDLTVYVVNKQTKRKKRS